MTMMKRLRVAQRLSQQRLAELVGTSQPQIRRLEAGEREMTKTWAERIAPHLNCSAEQLLFEAANVPIVGLVGAGGEAQMYQDGHGNYGEAPRPPGTGSSTVALEVRGDSMPGIAENEWLVYYDDVREGITPDLIGELCVVGIADGGVFIKRVYRAKDADLYDLISTGAEPKRNQKIAWAAKVTWIKPR